LQQQGFAWPTLADLDKHGMTLKDFLDTIEGRLIEEALGRSDGVKNQAAELLGIKRTTLIEQLKKKPGT
jgi:transcriptional regulator with PAS, ATPase and Fis domain